MATVSVSWAQLVLPAPGATISVSWAQLVLPGAPGGGLTLYDTAATARAGWCAEGFSLTASVDLGPVPALRAGSGVQAFNLGAAASASAIRRPVRAAAARPSVTLFAPGAPPLAAVMPTVVVEIDADPDTTGLFVIGTSVLDGPDVIAADHRWVQVPAADVRTVGIRRGRSREDNPVDVGSATIVLDGWSGAYDPDNPATPYQIAGDIKLRTGVGVRVGVVLSGASYPLFTGVLESTEADYGLTPTVTWTCVDAMSRLGSADVPDTANARGGELSSDRAAWLLDLAGITDHAITPGQRTLIPTDGGGTVLAHLEEVAFAEQGRVFADRTGVIRVTQHYEDYARDVHVTFDDTGTGVGYDDLRVEPGAAQVVNDATLKRTTKVFAGESAETVEAAFTASHAGSVERFGRKSLSRAVVLDHDAEAQALAEYLATVRAVPASRVSGLSSSLPGHSSPLLAAVCSLDLGDRVVVERTTVDGRSLSWTVHVEGIAHTLTPTEWSLDLHTSPTDNLALGADPWLVGVSVLDGPDVIPAY